MKNPIDDFERGARDSLQEYLSKDEAHSRKKPTLSSTKGLTVVLAVSDGKLSPDYEYTYKSDSISKLEAMLEAERAARKAGWRRIEYVVKCV